MSTGVHSRVDQYLILFPWALGVPCPVFCGGCLGLFYSAPCSFGGRPGFFSNSAWFRVVLGQKLCRNWLPPVASQPLLGSNPCSILTPCTADKVQFPKGMGPLNFRVDGHNAAPHPKGESVTSRTSNPLKKVHQAPKKQLWCSTWRSLWKWNSLNCPFSTRRWALSYF